MEKKSKLELFLSKCSPEYSRDTFINLAGHQLRASSAISAWICYLSHRFSIGLRELLSSFNDNLDETEFPYDAIAFEAATFCYFWLTEDCLNHENNSESSSFFDCISSSTQITSSIFEKNTTFSFNYLFFANRWFSYAAKNLKTEDYYELFSNNIISSYLSKSPTVSHPVILSTNLDLQLNVLTFISVFQESHYKMLIEVTDYIFESDKNNIEKQQHKNKKSRKLFGLIDYLKNLSIYTDFFIWCAFIGFIFISLFFYSNR